MYVNVPDEFFEIETEEDFDSKAHKSWDTQGEIYKVKINVGHTTVFEREYRRDTPDTNHSIYDMEDAVLETKKQFAEKLKQLLDT